MIGGGREVANATDAGALQVARQALVRGTVDISTLPSIANLNGGTDTALAEFGGCVANSVSPATPAPANTITLITYNRVIAQAMIVAQNALIEGTPAAANNATCVAQLAQQVGTALNASLNAAAASASPTGLQTDFNTLSGMANTKMWNGNAVTCTGITTGYLKPKGSTNVIFDTNTLTALGAIPGTAPALGTDLGAGNNTPSGSQDTLLQSINPGAQFMPGYDNCVFNLSTGAVTLTGVPVFPNTKPHLIDVGTFNGDTALNTTALGATEVGATGNTPPNCFNTGSKAVEAKSGNMGGSLACAVVGVLNSDFKASLPRGFVRIVNGQDAATGSNGNPALVNPVSDGTNDIFANQLMGTGIFQDSNNGGTPGNEVFTTTPGLLTDWSNFNNRLGASYNNLSSDPNVAAQAALLSPSVSVAYIVPAGSPSGTAINITDSVTSQLYHVYPVGYVVPQGELPTSAPNLNDMSVNPSNYDAGDGGLRSGAVCNQYANNNELQAIGLSSTTTNCVYTDFGTNWATPGSVLSPCSNVSGGSPASAVTVWENNYMCMNVPTSGGGPIGSGVNQGVTNVEYMKEELLVNIAGRLGGSYCADITIPSAAPSGVKYFPNGTPGTGGTADAFDPTLAGTEGSSQYVNFETVATPFMYLQQITNGSASSLGSCGQGSTTASIVGQITSRLQQVDSSVTQTQVATALNTSGLNLHLVGSGVTTENDNGTLYLYVDAGTHQVTMCTLANLPAGFSDGGAVADGPAPSSVAGAPGECTEQYPLNGWVVDTQIGVNGNGTPLKGDAHYHDQPFTQPATSGMTPTYTNGPLQGSGASGSSVNYPATQSVQGQDAAIFTQSSGYQNLLGTLNFTENVQGTTFCRPN
jgi:hypothetical protein